MARRIVSPDDLERWLAQAPGPDAAVVAAARQRQAELLKPPGALGRLEELGIWLSGWQGTVRPRADRIQVIVFAGNHGVTEENISPYPSSVTAQMVANFRGGGAAINVLASVFGYELDVVPVELDRPTANIARAPAMTADECVAAIDLGARSVSNDVDVLLLGEMGIGNTTISAALAAAMFGGGGADWAGAGTGLSTDGIAHKARVIDRALALHRPECTSAFETLRRLGGREQAAIVGALIEARLRRIPTVLDGFVVTAAAATLTSVRADALDHCIAGHVSSEAGHRRLLAELKLEPLLALGMRLGEASGAAVAGQILRAAAATQSRMTTFDEAGVSGARRD